MNGGCPGCMFNLYYFCFLQSAASDTTDTSADTSTDVSADGAAFPTGYDTASLTAASYPVSAAKGANCAALSWSGICGWFADT